MQESMMLELNIKLNIGTYDITLEKDRYVVEEPSYKVKCYITMDSKVLEYYLEGYKSIRIIKVNDVGQIVLEGDVKEIKQLISALSRNVIRAVRGRI